MKGELKRSLRPQSIMRRRLWGACLLAWSAVILPAAGAGEYDRLRVVSPPENATVRDNSGNVAVVVDVSPPLRVDAGDRIVLRLDGKAVAHISETHYPLPGVNRGTHTMQAEVRSINGSVYILSEPVTFHLHQASRVKPAARR